MSEWPSITVGELVQSGSAEIKTGPFGTQLKASHYVETGCPVINVRNVGQGELTDAKLEHVGPETVKRLKSHLLKVGDIVFGRKAAVDRHLWVTGQNGWMQGSDCLRLRLDEGVISTRFVSFYLRTAEHRDWILRQSSHGSTMATLNQSIIERITIPFPPLETQRRIAAILGAYDDLIEVNRRRIAVLEEMARGLFEEWFVRFRFPGHEAVPILDTQDGPLPEGWRNDTLGNVAAINAASLRPANAPSEIGYIDIASVSPGKIDTINHMPFAGAPGRARRIVTDGSILWSNVRPNRRSFAVVLDPTPEIVASTGFTVLDARETSFAYLYHWVTTDNFVGYLVGNAQGAAYPAVTAATFERAAILLPPADLVKRFTDFAEPMLRLADSLRKTSGSLATSRDLLLPRLISGLLSVAEAERELEAA